MHKASLTAAILGLVLIVSPAAQAAELKVLAGGAMIGPMKEIAAKFEAASGHKLDIFFGTTPELVKQATTAPFDVAVVPVDVFKNADAKAKFTAAPTIDIARVGFSVAVKAGAPKPDISTPDAFKAALLKAPSITTLPASAAGSYILKVFDRLGIADAMKAKTKVQTAPGGIPAAVVNGEAELGLFLTNVLIAPGVDIVGPFPGDLQNDLVFTSGVAADTKQADAAKAFIAFLKSPESVATIKAKGLNPG